MGQWSRLVLVLWFLQLAVGGGLAADQLCRRLMLTGLREDHTAYYMYAGIYEVQDYLHQGFPVLKKSNLFFSYDESKNWFVIGFAVGEMNGLAASTQPDLNSKIWLKEARSDEPFSGILNRWYETIDTTDTGSYIEGDIRFKCVDDEYQSCDSGKMAFDTALVQNPGQPNEAVLNIPGQFYYEVIPHLYHNNRPVYELKPHSLGNNFKLYYCYESNGWAVGPHFPTQQVLMIAEDHALYPEQIVSEWKYFTNGALRSTSAKLQCLGVTSWFGKSCDDTMISCQNGGTCHGKPSGEEICLCESNFYGVTCEKTRAKCPMPNSDVNNPGPGYFDILDGGNNIGSIGTVFCHKGHEPQYFPIVCAAKADQVPVGEWKGLQPCCLGTAISRRSRRLKREFFRPYDQTSLPYTTIKPFFHHTFEINTMTVGICLALQLVLPLFIGCIISCLDKEKRKGRYSRICSLAFNVGFWVWIPLVTIISVLVVQSEITVTYLRALWLYGVICLPIGYLWVLIESFYSRELGYLRELNKVEDAAAYLKQLRETVPHFVMSAVCYHYEKRRKIVLSRKCFCKIKTYLKSIVTFADTEMFRYGYWMNTSDNRFAFSHKYGVTRIKLKKTVLVGDADTAARLSEAEKAFRAKHRSKDTFMDYSCEIVVDGFRQRFCSYVDPNHRSWWIGTGWFWVATILLMSWPYRWHFRAQTGKAKFKLEKRIYMTRPQHNEDDNTDCTAYHITQEQESNIYQNLRENPVAENPGTEKKNDNRKSKKKKRKKLKTDVDIELGAVSARRY